MLRIVRCTTDADRAPEVDTYLARVGRTLAASPGNADAYAGKREADGLVHYALVTAWHGFDALQAAVGRDILHAPLLDPVADLVRDVTVEHLERMDLPPIGTGGEATILRLYELTIGHRQAEQFYAFTRDTAWPAVGTAEGIVSGHVGRRMASDIDHVVLVTAWRSWESLVGPFPDAEERPLAVPDDERLVSRRRIEHFDIIRSATDG